MLRGRASAPGLNRMREFYLNADFDHALSGRPSLLETADPTYVHEMAWHFLLAGGPEDTVIVHAAVPGGFAAYAQGKGLALPRAVLHPAYTSEAEFVPFGWNARTVSLAARYARLSSAPDADAVKTANSRAFASSLEEDWYGDGGGRLFSHRDALSAFLSDRPATENWVAKGDHGYAGTANRRLPGGPLSSEDEIRIDLLFAGHGRVVLEPWHERIQDMAALFVASRDGMVEGFRGHALLNSRDGAFLGVEVAPDGLPPAPWRDGLRANADRLAKALSFIGYFGPVGVDGYVHRTAEGPRLRLLVDINARLSMALPAHGLARRLPGRFVRWSWHKPRKLSLPESYSDLDARLGDAAFDPAATEGILAVSPLFREDGSGLRPKRVGFALIARTAAGLDRLQTAFVEALGRRP
jgi:hypothetical protein